MQLEIAPRAEEDLENIVNFIATDKPAAARRWLEKMYQLFSLIAERPMLFRWSERQGWASDKQCLAGTLCSFAHRVTGFASSAFCMVCETFHSICILRSACLHEAS